jgi:hypothetical protein
MKGALPVGGALFVWDQKIREALDPAVQLDRMVE